MFVPPKRLYICIDTGLNKYETSSSIRRDERDIYRGYQGGSIIPKNYKEYEARMSGINGTLIQDAGVLFNPYKKLTSASINRHPSEILSKYPDILKYQFLNEEFFTVMPDKENPPRVFVDVNDEKHILTEKTYSTLVESGFAAVTAAKKVAPGPDIQDKTIALSIDNGTTISSSNTEKIYTLKSSTGVKVFNSGTAKIRSEDHATKYVKTENEGKGKPTVFILKDILDLGARASDGTIRNNIQMTVETLFKRGSILQIDGKKYIVYDFKCNYSNWKLLPCGEPKIYCSGGKYDAIMNSFKLDVAQFISLVKSRFQTSNVKSDESSKKIRGLVLSAFKSFCDSFSLAKAEPDKQFKKILRSQLNSCLSLYSLNVPSEALMETTTTTNTDFFIDITKTLSEVSGQQEGGASAIALLKEKFTDNEVIFSVGGDNMVGSLGVIKKFSSSENKPLFSVLADLINEYNNNNIRYKNKDKDKDKDKIKEIDEYELTREFMKYTKGHHSNPYYGREREDDGIKLIRMDDIGNFMYEKYSLSICVFKYVNNDISFCSYTHSSSSWITFLIYNEADNEFSSLKIQNTTLFKFGAKDEKYRLPEFLYFFLGYHQRKNSRSGFMYAYDTLNESRNHNIYKEILDEETGATIGTMIERMFLKCSTFQVKIEYFGDDNGREISSYAIDYKLGYFIDVKLELKEWTEQDEKLLKNTCNIKYTKILQDLKYVYKDYSKWLPKSREKNKKIESLYKGIYRNIKEKDAAAAAIKMKEPVKQQKQQQQQRRFTGGMTRKKMRGSKAKGNTRRRVR